MIREGFFGTIYEIALNHGWTRMLDRREIEAREICERTGFRFTKRRPQKLPDSAYLLAHCIAGWFLLTGPVLNMVDIDLDILDRVGSVPKVSPPILRLGRVRIRLTRDEHYPDGQYCIWNYVEPGAGDRGLIHEVHEGALRII